MFNIDREHIKQNKIRNSLFISHIYMIHSIKDVKDKINYLSLKHPSANHFCYAYRLHMKNDLDLFDNLIINEYCNDDGEPSGTAGRPILNIINKYDLVNVVIITIRYFGGVKLGIRGLIDAYSETSDMLIKDINCIKWSPKRQMIISYDYKFDKLVKSIIDNENIEILNSDYSSIIKIILLIDLISYKKVKCLLNEKSNGTIIIDECIY